MSEEVIGRVDELIRKNNMKYKDEQSQKAYEQALKDYERQTKFEQAKQYAQSIKEGNRRAVEKAKAVKKAEQQQKRKRKVAPLPLPEQVKQEKKIDVVKKRMSEAELALCNRTIEARADRLIQEQQLEKLNKKLDEQKKRTKLFELNEKCKKMVSKSQERIPISKRLPESRMNMLKEMEQRALGQLNELDNIINNLAGQVKQTKSNARPTTAMPARRQEQKFVQSQEQEEQYEENEEDMEDIEVDESLSDEDNFRRGPEYKQNFLDLNTILFQKSSEQLLQMDYIPI